MSVLLHSCCGPCLSGSYPILESEIGQGQTAVFWENPNIHPFVEYYHRMASFIKMAKIYELPIIKGKAEYGLNGFLLALNGQYGVRRCETCYRLRLEATAKTAKENSFTEISTTLLISPYQNHELITKVGNEAAEKYGIKFRYTDFRPGFKDSHELARKHELYRQKYCGCIFSEHDRYKEDPKHFPDLWEKEG